MGATLINRVTGTASGNFATGTGSFDPGKMRGMILHPLDADLLSIASNATTGMRKAALQALLVEAVYENRAFFIHTFEDNPVKNGEDVAYETRGQLKKEVDKGSWDYTFPVDGKWEVYQMLQKYHKRGGLLVAFIDENNVLYHLTTSTGLCGLTVHEITVPMFDMPETGKFVRYYIRVALANIDEVKTMKHTELGFNPFHPKDGLIGVQDWVLEDVTPGGAGAGIFDVALKNANSQKLLVSKYAAILNAAGAWDVTSPEGDAITVSSVTIVTEGTDKVAFRLTLDTSDADYDIGDVLNIKLKPIATLAASPYLIKYAETNTVNVTAN